MPTMFEFVDSVCNSPTLYGGTCVRKFSQALPPVSSLIGTYGVTANGICMALSNRWIVDHALGSSLWNWLCATDGRVQSNKIANLMINFMDGVGGKAPKGTHPQQMNAEHYMFLYGIIRRTDVVSGDRQTLEGGSANVASAGMGTSFGNAIVNQGLKNANGSYRLLTTFGPKGGHAMAAFVGQDAMFFDPNFGEFYFEDRRKFPKWFSQFWQISGYGGMFGSVAIRDYAVKAGHVTARPGDTKGRI